MTYLLTDVYGQNLGHLLGHSCSLKHPTNYGQNSHKMMRPPPFFNFKKLAALLGSYNTLS